MAALQTALLAILARSRHVSSQTAIRLRYVICSLLLRCEEDESLQMRGTLLVASNVSPEKLCANIAVQHCAESASRLLL